jgi:arylsulfatase A-like enzyme
MFSRMSALVVVLPITLMGSIAHAAAQPATSKSRPNVILIMTDDQGYGDMSCHGNPVLKTPNLDKLHKESVRLTDFHVAPMCTPTRGQLLTGRDALANGAMNVSSGRTFLRRGIPTIADLLRRFGYLAGLFGKWHLGDNYPFRPHDRGFHEAIWFPSSHISSAPDYWNNDYFDDHYRHNGAIKQFQGYCTDVFFGEAMKWMKTCQAKKEPFFAYIAPNAPHGPLFVSDKYRKLYAGQKPQVASFYGMIANIDENLGKLEAFLVKEGLKDNTIVIFLTDNGGTAGVPVFNAGMRGRKIELYEGGHRVPCFIRWPAGKLSPPGDIAELTQCQDLVPTLLELCGDQKPIQEKFDGTSLVPLLRGTKKQLPDRMLVVQFSRMGSPQPQKGDAAVLWQRWRLIQDKELYDLKTDPVQKTNVLDKHPDVVKKMREHYDRWWSGIEPKLNQFEAISVGSDAENPVHLSPADWQDVFLDQSRQVRVGEKKNGGWNVIVEKAGDYQITLRRWPSEANTPIRAATPEVQIADGKFPAGVALPIAKARLKIGGHDLSKAVSETANEVSLTVTLKPGRTQLQTWFHDAASREICGAYFVEVRRLDI